MDKFKQLSKKELQHLYQFYSTARIAAQFGISAEVVRRRIHELGIVIQKVGGRRAFDPPRDVLDELYQTKSMREIAEHFGVGETVVFKRLKEHGIELKEHGNHRLKPGRVFTEEHKQNIRKSQIERAAYGEKNPNWKGGLTEVNRRARGSWMAREWKQQSLARAGNKCERCGVENGKTCECCGVKIKLHVHHIKSFAKYPDIRFDPANSEVLCPKCHHDEHRGH
jgi:transposase